MKEFNNIEEMKEYYDEEKNLFYIEDDIKINFDLICYWNITALDISALNIDAVNINARNITAKNIDIGNIDAWDIKAKDISARNIIAKNIDAEDIDAWNIDAWNIKALDISFHAVCFAYNDIICKSIKGRRENNTYFALDGNVIIKEEL